jgi:hypothetical protein
MSNEILSLPVSLGEAIDKLTILDIKLEKIKDDRKQDVQIEYELLFDKLKDFILKYQELYQIMKRVNILIWEMMDILRDGDISDLLYLKTCKKCIEYNDIRFRVKNKINYISNSTLKEQKGYRKNRILIELNNQLTNIDLFLKPIKYLSFIYDEIYIYYESPNPLLQEHFSYDPTVFFRKEEETEIEYVKKYSFLKTEYECFEQILEIFEITNMNFIKKNAYFVSHMGLGDNITNISAVLYLLKYYNTIYFLCKDHNKENAKSFFANKNVVIVPFNSKDEYSECKNIISNLNKDEYDWFVSGYCHTKYLQSHITHPELINYVKKNNITVEFDHIYDFYNDIGLDLSIYIDYFEIDSTETSLQYYHDIQNYNIIFLHTKGSNRYVDLRDKIDMREEYMIICANENMYEKDHVNYTIANNYINLKIVDYIDIIKNANMIHVIDSCFSCIVYPLEVSNRLKSIDTKIYRS